MGMGADGWTIFIQSTCSQLFTHSKPIIIISSQTEPTVIITRLHYYYYYYYYYYYHYDIIPLTISILQ